MTTVSNQIPKLELLDLCYEQVLALADMVRWSSRKLDGVGC